MGTARLASRTRFAEFLPSVDATVYDIATTGTPEDQRTLWSYLDGVRAAIDAQAARTLGDAVAEYVAAISEQHDDRLEALLVRTGLGGQDPITGAEMARRLGVSGQRASQITRRLWFHRDRCRPPAGVWMPQVVEAERNEKEAPNDVMPGMTSLSEAEVVDGVALDGRSGSSV